MIAGITDKQLNRKKQEALNNNLQSTLAGENSLDYMTRQLISFYNTLQCCSDSIPLFQHFGL